MAAEAEPPDLSSGSGGGCVVTKHLSSSDSTPNKPPTSKTIVGMDASRTLAAIDTLDKKVDSLIAALGHRLDQQRNELTNHRISTEQRHKNVENNLHAKIESESNSIKEELQMKLVNVND